jgi:hypothetical protein
MCPVHDRFVNIDISVAYFQVIAAIWIGADPGLVMDGRPLVTEIGKGYQVSVSALTTLR